MRRFSLFGDALAHSAFGGVAFGLFIGIYPLWIACSVAILSALGLTKIRQKFDISSDAIVAILLSTGLGAGVILVSLTEDLDIHDIEEFLFGSAIIDTQNVITILVMAGASYWPFFSLHTRNCSTLHFPRSRLRHLEFLWIKWAIF